MMGMIVHGDTCKQEVEDPNTPFNFTLTEVHCVCAPRTEEPDDLYSDQDSKGGPLVGPSGQGELRSTPLQDIIPVDEAELGPHWAAAKAQLGSSSEVKKTSPANHAGSSHKA